MFYKIIYKGIVIDIIEDAHWVIWVSKSGRFILTDETSANGIVSSDSSEVFHLMGRPEFVGYKNEYKTVTVVDIEADEYQSISSHDASDIITDNGEVKSISQLISDKVSEMSRICEDTIVAGFDIDLSDMTRHHFSLQLSDQLKITKLNDRAVAGEEFLPYHADNELCKIFSAQDIMLINDTMEHIIEYQVTYFNSLKAYIGSMTDKYDIINVEYGMNIPEEYQSDVLKLLLSQTTDGE